MEKNFLLDDALALWAFVCGGFLCAVYDIFRIIRFNRKSNALIVFFGDILFCIIAALTMLILFFNLSFGSPRVYAFVFAFLGFLAWRFTLSRILMAVMDKLDRLVRRMLRSIKMRVSALYQRLYRRLYTRLYCRKTLAQAKKGFGILKRKEFEKCQEEDLSAQI